MNTSSTITDRSSSKSMLSSFEGNRDDEFRIQSPAMFQRRRRCHQPRSGGSRRRRERSSLMTMMMNRNESSSSSSSTTIEDFEQAVEYLNFAIRASTTSRFLDVIYEIPDDMDENHSSSDDDYDFGGAAMMPPSSGGSSLLSSPMRRAKTYASLLEDDGRVSHHYSGSPLGLVATENTKDDEWGYYEEPLDNEE